MRLGLVLSLIITTLLAANEISSAATSNDVCEGGEDNQQGECKNSNNENQQKIRLITKEELELKTGEDGSEIWLSVLGDVYDVTEGKSFYGKGSSYGALAAKDCSVCYVSGIFSAEEGEKNPIDLSDSMLPALLEWSGFYSSHDSYKFVGFLVDPRYYNEQGEPTKNLSDIRQRLAALSSAKKK